MKKLNHFLSTPVKNGYSPVCTDKPTSKIVLGLGALTGTGLNLNQVKWVPESNEQVDNFIIETGDFLVSRSNTLDRVGRAALYRGGLSNCSYPDLMMKFRVNEEKILPDFMELILQSTPARKHFMRCASGTSSTMVKITKSTVESLKIPEFPLAQQREIVHIARTWESAIEKTEDLIAAKEKQFEWSCRIQITKNHRKVDLSNICTIKTGRKDVNEGSINGKYPFFTCAKKPIYSDLYSFDTTAILIAGNGNIGNPKLYSGKFEAYQRTYVLFDFKDVDPYFLVFFLQSQLQEKIDKERQQGAMPYIKLNTLSRFKVFLPELDEQARIAVQLNTAQYEIKLLKELLEKYRLQKRGLMQKLLTGEWQASKTTFKEVNA